MTTDELLAEIARLRDALKRIQALVWYEPQDEKDLVEAVRSMVRERDEARFDLARCREVQAMRRERDESRAEVEQLPGDAGLNYWLRRLMRERDEARAEVERLRGQLLAVKQECDELREYAETVGLRAVTDASETYKVVVGERDIAEAEVERLRAALAQAQRTD